jgi:drug/metabolite transporter (DMT)-like permease
MTTADADRIRAYRDAGAFVFLMMMVLFGSSTATAAKFVVRELPIGFVPTARFGLAGLCLLGLTGRAAAWRVWARDRRRLLTAAALGVPINQAFFLSGTRLAPTSHVAFLYATSPLVVLLLATAIGQERITPARLGGVLVAVLGAVILALGDLATHRGAASAATLRGDLLLVGAVLAWGGYLTVNKPLVVRHGALPTMAATFLTGALLDLPVAAWTLARHHDAIEAASPAAWWGFLVLVLIGTILTLGCQNQALKRLDASQVATVGNAAPLLTVLWGVWLLGETSSPSLVVGGGLILTGIVWTGRAGRDPGPPPDGGP